MSCSLKKLFIFVLLDSRIEDTSAPAESGSREAPK
jgi:hypothetical protein